MFGELLGVHEKMFKDLLVVDQLRGRDSTGVLSVKRHADHQILKVVGGPEELSFDKRYDGLFQGAINALIGHNRWKTKGSVNRRNAHPFETPNLVGVHNGTLNNQWKLENGNSYDVDSEALFNHIDRHGIKNAMEVADGAYALVWWDKFGHTVNFVRNKDRPLYMAFTQDKKVMILASEPWMIEGCAERNSVALMDAPILVALDNVVTVPVAKGTGVLGKPKVFHYQRPEPPVVVVNRGGSYRAPLTTVNNNAGDPLLGEKGKGVLFEVGKTSLTPNNARFYELLPVLAGFEGKKFIVFDHQKTLEKLMTGVSYITADISHKSTVQGVSIDTYIIAPNSMEVCETVEVSELLSDIGVETKKDEEEDDGVRYPQLNGPALSKEEYEEKFPFCNVCMQDIKAEQKNEFNKAGDIICEDCCKDKDVREQVGLPRK